MDPIERTASHSTLLSMSSDVRLEPQASVRLVLQFTPQEIDMVRSSWKEMISDDLSKDGTHGQSSSMASSLFCIQFYSNLMAMEPELEKMFPSIKHQAMSFAGVLSTAIINLEELDKLDDYLNNLGKRHARILGIEAPHYELMGTAFLKTFHDRFGQHLSLGLERCWARLYTYLANSILQSGIDPVLRIEKMNAEIHTMLERSPTQNTTIFDQRSISTTSNNSSLYGSHTPSPLHQSSASRSPLHSQDLRKASGKGLIKSVQPMAIPENAPLTMQKKRLGGKGKDDKDCVIM